MARKSKQPSSAPSPKLHASPRTTVAIRLFAQYGRLCMYSILLYVLLKWVLPALAELTPPGISLEDVKRAADEKLLYESAGCPDACKGLVCPTGWKTSRKPENPCKCICARKQGHIRTPWDEEREKAKKLANGEANHQVVGMQSDDHIIQRDGPAEAARHTSEGRAVHDAESQHNQGDTLADGASVRDAISTAADTGAELQETTGHQGAGSADAAAAAAAAAADADGVGERDGMAV